MAIRDRVTVTLKSGAEFHLQATRQGGTVRQNRNARAETLEIEELNGAKKPEVIRSMEIALSEVAVVVVDQGPPGYSKKRKASVTITKATATNG